MKSAKKEILEADVTPELALEWLTVNVNNRTISRKHVRMLADAMRHDRFEFVGDPIRFDREGRLLDGQHRLEAIIESETTQHMAVMVGLDPTDQVFMDTGRRRNPGDQLLVALGIRDGNRAAAIARTYLMWKDRVFISQTRTFSMPELVDWAEANESLLVDATRRSRTVTGHKVPTSGAVCGAVYLAAHELSPTDAAVFFERLSDGAELEVTNPILVLRNKIIKVARQDRWTQVEEFAYYTRAWNAWRANDQLQRLQGWRGAITLENLRLR